jgi:nucleoside-diphosphate-sugar epimerase
MTRVASIGVTGSRGVIGRQLVQIANLLPDLTVSSYDGDIRDAEEVKLWAREASPDMVFHLAAVVPTVSAASDKAYAREVNEFGTAIFARAVLEGARGRPVRFVYTSTSHVYQSNENPISEQGSLEPRNFYATTKLGGERALQFLASTEQNFDLVVARVFSIYSEFQSPSFLFPSLVKKITPGMHRQKIELPGWNNVRDFLHARQAAELLLLLSRSRSSGVVNLGSGFGRSIKGFAEDIFGVELEVRECDADPDPASLVAETGFLASAIGVDRFKKIAGEAPAISSG